MKSKAVSGGVGKPYSMLAFKALKGESLLISDNSSSKLVLVLTSADITL